MKIRVKVIFPDRQFKWWYFTTEHPQSSYNLPVLVDENDNPYGPADLALGTIIKVASKNILAAEGGKLAGYSIQD